MEPNSATESRLVVARSYGVSGNGEMLVQGLTKLQVEDELRPGDVTYSTAR